jgi:hypothetical protein
MLVPPKSILKRIRDTSGFKHDDLNIKRNKFVLIRVAGCWDDHFIRDFEGLVSAKKED